METTDFRPIDQKFGVHNIKCSTQFKAIHGHIAVFIQSTGKKGL